MKTQQLKKEIRDLAVEIELHDKRLFTLKRQYNEVCDTLFLKLYKQAKEKGFDKDKNVKVLYKEKEYSLYTLFLDRDDLILRALLTPQPENLAFFDKKPTLKELKLKI